MPKFLRDFVNSMIEEWGEDNPFYGLKNNGQLVEQWTNLDGLEIFYSYVRNSKWVTVTVLPTETGIHPVSNSVYKWKGYINEYIAETAVWWAFELLTEMEAKKFMIQHKPEVKFTFIRLGHPYELVVKFDGYCWVVED
ncbi:MAG: hypothetical protein GYA16_07405 [Spirochaetes bacterium]|nr:hypothetical protein [Spirochaetota bacterium]